MQRNQLATYLRSHKAFCCQNYCETCEKIKVAVLQTFDRVKFVALWSANIRKLTKVNKSYGSADNLYR